ncbi:hypothetical protein P154DRAFT_254586 [Amniculicola lignicola CBS 123094]|uniref:Uncharacterized protein n=1 Tax=Amniculicola lignicola CBS 123094 TaxID=1392246 RepID=A0A6A5X1Y8_9PLEO|nr:hypothetical protein P154DRAFT_254586 [Amniculicola lignicola CBS 123094]
MPSQSHDAPRCHLNSLLSFLPCIPPPYHTLNQPKQHALPTATNPSNPPPVRHRHPGRTDPHPQSHSDRQPRARPRPRLPQQRPAPLPHPFQRHPHPPFPRGSRFGCSSPRFEQGQGNLRLPWPKAGEADCEDSERGEWSRRWESEGGEETEYSLLSVI